MTDRHILPLNTQPALAKAMEGVRVAFALGGWVLELRPAKRTDEQNDALHGLIAQIIKQRPTHFGVKADKDVYKAMFMHALGQETRFVPTLDGDGLFPMGQRTSKLTKAEFTSLIEYILAWCAREGLTVEHFDHDSKGAGGVSSPARRAA